MVNCRSLILLLAIVAGARLGAADAPVSPQAQLYEQNCAMCHYAGKGNAAAPDLIGTAFWAGGPKPMITMMLHGQSGVSVVNGKKFNGQMPPMDYLSNEEIAAITAYVLKTFGNQTVEVTPASVAQLRAAAKDQPDAAPSK